MHTYDTLRRGLTSSRAAGIEALSVQYLVGVTRLTDSLGHATDYHFALAGGRKRLNAVDGTGCASCGAQGTLRNSFDTSGHLLSKLDANFNEVGEYSYDGRGNVVTALNGGATYQYTYNDFGQVLTATDPFGKVTTNTYDAKGNLLSTAAPSPDGSSAGPVTTFEYDAKGQVTRVIDQLRNATDIEYFPTGLIQTIRDALNRKTRYTYDARGLRTTIVDPLSQTTTIDHDAVGLVTRIVYPDNSQATFGYDYRQRKTSATDTAGRTTEYVYDVGDRLVQVVDAQLPAHGTTHYFYDNESNLRSITDAKGQTTSFVYDAKRRVVQTAHPSTQVETFEYDNAGNLTAQTDRLGRRTTFEYDAINRLTRKVAGPGLDINYTYDLLNRLTFASGGGANGAYAMFYDALGRLTGTDTAYSFLPSALSVRYEYDLEGNRTRMIDPQGRQTRYTYDKGNELMSLASPQGHFEFKTDKAGRRRMLSRPNGITTEYRYDSLSRPQSITHVAGSRVVDGAAYAYDAAGNVSSKTDLRTSTRSAYHYDALNQLLMVTQGVTNTEQYEYDAVGNRTQDAATTLTYDGANELLTQGNTSYSYDPAGSRTSKNAPAGTSSYSWDWANRLESVNEPDGTAAAFQYDPFGRRIRRQTSTETAVYLYDGPNVLEQLDASGAETARYTMSLNVDEPLAQLRGGVVSHYESDAIGSVTSLTDSRAALVNTYSYSAFGVSTQTNAGVQNAFGFAGREREATGGLYYNRNRYYDPGTGRFLSEDPLGFRSGSENVYTYVEANPVSFADPFGLSGWLVINSRGNGGSSMTSGHSWIAFTPDNGTTTTFGTWGNNPLNLGNGLHENLELGQGGDASRSVWLNDAEQAKLFALIQQYKSRGANAWTLGGPCSKFATGAWSAATGERLNAYWGPINNPTTLKESIIAKNGGANTQVNYARPKTGSSRNSNVSSSFGSFGSLVNSLGSLLK